jgi:hypothetical protein
MSFALKHPHKIKRLHLHHKNGNVTYRRRNWRNSLKVDVLIYIMRLGGVGAIGCALSATRFTLRRKGWPRFPAAAV